MFTTKKTIAFLLLFTLTFLSVFSMNDLAYANSSFGKMLVAHYKFDGDFRDYAGLGHDGIKVGSISFVDGVSGKAAKFDGESYIEVEDSDYLDFDTGFTFSVWVYKEDSRPLTTQPILSKTAGGTEYYPYAFIDEDFYPSVRLIDQYENTSPVHSEAKADFQKWQLLTATFDGKNVKFYQNGVLKDNKAFPSTLPTSDGNLYIGSDIAGETTFFQGVMDDIRIYNYALTPTEIEATYNEIARGAGKDLVNKPKSLVAYYKFDSDFKDFSGFKNDGIAFGGVSGITFTDGISGKAAKFDGNSYMEVKDSDSLDLDKTFTFAGWIYKEASEMDQPILSKVRSSIDEGYSSYSWVDEDGYLGIELWDEYENHACDYSDDMTDIQKWYFFTATYDGNNVKFYHNGVLKDTKPIKSPMPYSSGELLIGNNIEGDTAFFKGMMDELRIYNYTLTSEEVQALYGTYGQKPSAPSSGSTVIKLQLNNPKMTLNDKEREIDPGQNTAPVSINGRTMIPIRALIESLGGILEWEGKENKITIKLDKTVIQLWLNKDKAIVNGKEKSLDVPPKSINGRTMMPVRFVSENLGCQVEWNEKLKQVIITRPEGGGEW